MERPVRWAGKNLSEAELGAVNATLASGNRDAVKLALDGVKAEDGSGRGCRPDPDRRPGPSPRHRCVPPQRRWPAERPALPHRPGLLPDGRGEGRPEHLLMIWKVLRFLTFWSPRPMPSPPASGRVGGLGLAVYSATRLPVVRP